MSIAWSNFTPGSAILGGLMIGVASGLYVLGVGRIAGIAGIIASPLQALIKGTRFAPERTRVFFIGGLLLAPWAWRIFAASPRTIIDVGPSELIVAGLLVGFGVRMGNGCTSGHGVCGLSRFSLRSLVNVLAFMGAGFITVYAQRHLT